MTAIRDRFIAESRAYCERQERRAAFIADAKAQLALQWRILKLTAAFAAGLALAIMLASAIAFAHYVPDPCHPQTQHTEGCTHDQDDDHQHQGDR